MLAIWRLALNTLAGKPGRTALMIGAVALAASLVMAVACAMASIQATTERGITRFVGKTDARIIHQGNGRFSETLLNAVREWPEVEAAAGRLAASLTLVHADNRRNPTTGELLRVTPRASGVEFNLEGKFRLHELSAGVLPASASEILIDPAAAEKLEAKVGDVLEVQRFGEPITLKVSGVIQRARLGAVQRPLIEIDRRVLAEATGREKELTSIVIIVKKGVDVAQFCAKYQTQLPAIVSLEPAELVRSGFDRQLEASRFGFTIASMLTFMCASFIIVTAMTTSVTQRQRELAVLRSIGASRAQVFMSQMLAGGMVAGSGALIGIPLGIALTAMLVWYFSEYLSGGMHVHPLGFQLAIIGSFAAGLLGAVYPAFMASRVSPLQAMSFRARPPRNSSIVLCGLIGLLLIAAQLALFTIKDPSQRFIVYAYAGLPCLLVGYFVLATPILIIATRSVGGVLSTLLRLPRGMLQGSILSTPFRHGFTAGALMVGIAILVSTWSNMTSLLHDWLGHIKFADGFAYRTTGITPNEQQAIANLPFVTTYVPISYLPLRVFDRQIFGVQGLAPPNVTCMGFDPDVFFAVNAIKWEAVIPGGPNAAIARLKDGDAMIVADRFLTTQKVKIGDKLTLGVGRVRKQFEIVGAVNSAGLDIATQAFGIRSQYMEYSISCVFMDWKTVNETFDNRDAHLMQLNLTENADEKVIRKAIAEVAPGVQFNSGRSIVKTIDEVATAIMAVQSTIAFAALVLASLGVGNVILANIHGRRYEYGVLRAVGAHRRLLARLIFGEAAVLAIAGALVGTLLGLHLAWVGSVHYRDLAGLPVRMTLPPVPTAAGWILVIVLALLAALPGVLSVVKRQPSALLAAGRNG